MMGSGQSVEDTGSSRSLSGRQDQSDMESTRVYGYKGFTEIAPRFLGFTKDFLISGPALKSGGAGSGRSCRGSKREISPLRNIREEPHEEGEIQENMLRSVQKGEEQITKPIPSVAQLETNLAQTDPTEVIMNFVEMENGLELANKALEVGAKVLDEDMMEEKDKSLDGASGVAEENNSIENVDQLKKGKKLWEQFVIVDFLVSNVLISSLSIFVSHWCLVFIWNLRGMFGVTWSHCLDINFLVVLVASHGSLAARQFLCQASSTQLQRSSFCITTVMELFFMVAQVDDMVSIKLDVYHHPL
ncbi:hypothetical protein DY000_02045945 [Brassica cretica]|uniref:Uncharacterized protein n=1 Tax=Brassica cretica TaxID=69181 RepID=A0ABQ7ESZ1_BRACR|nr:hypothetical protein DY000_02045945 [Brassica cretica]